MREPLNIAHFIIRAFFCATNLFFLFLGGIFLAVSPSLLPQLINLGVVFGEAYRYLILVINITSIIIFGMFFLALLGLCGMCAKLKNALLWYALMLTAVFCFQMSFGIYTSEIFLKEDNWLLKNITSDLRKSVQCYNQSYEVRVTIDTVQSFFRCCGATNYGDYENKILPRSCYAVNSDRHFEIGCAWPVSIYFESIRCLFDNISWVLKLFEINGIAASLILIKTL